METREAAVNAQDVKEHLIGLLEGLEVGYGFTDKAPGPRSASVVEDWRADPRSQRYLFRLKDSAGSVEVFVTEEAMRLGDATGVAQHILVARDELKAAQQQRGRWVVWAGGLIVAPGDDFAA